jgi:hypothetical protein
MERREVHPIRSELALLLEALLLVALLLVALLGTGIGTGTGGHL